MLVSGYLYYFSCEKRELKDLLKHRTQSLLQPIVVGGIFIFLTTTAIFSAIKGDFSVFINGKWLSSLSGLWFLWSVLSASLVLGIVYKLVKKVWLQVILLIVCSVVVLLFPNAENNLFMYPYYVIGFYFAKYKGKIKKGLLNVKYAFIILFPVLMLFFEKSHYIYTTGMFGTGQPFAQVLGVDFFRYAVGLVGSICVISIMELLYNFVIVKKPTFFLWKGLGAMGKRSLHIYTLSVVFLSSYLTVLYPKVVSLIPSIDLFFNNHIWIYNLGFTLVLGIIYSVLIMAVIQIFQKIKLNKILFGR